MEWAIAQSRRAERATEGRTDDHDDGEEGEGEMCLPTTALLLSPSAVRPSNNGLTNYRVEPQDLTLEVERN